MRSTTQHTLPSSQTICGHPARQPLPRRAVSKNRKAVQTYPCAIAEAAAPVIEREQDDDVVAAPARDAESVKFQWFSHWYPVLPLSFLETDKPSKYTVLGIDMVLWPDQDGKWRAAKDACPHRLAALSEGWLDNGQLQCRYHGWGFDGSGQCTHCPQASPELEQRITSTPRGNLQTFPTVESNGLLWVWPSSDPQAWIESHANPPHVDPELTDPAWVSAGSEWDVLEQPVSWQSLVENSMDPSHGTFLHEGVIGNKKNAAPMSMSVSQRPSAAGFQIKHDGYTKAQHEDTMDALRIFRPPGYVRMHYQQKSGKQTLAGIYFVPVTPQKTRIVTKFLFKSKEGSGNIGGAVFGTLAKAAEQTGLLHVLGAGLVDQDAFMLHTQELATARAQKKQGSYRLATPADTGVATLWRWLDLVGGIPYADGRSMFDLKPRTRQELLDRWIRHTKYCPTCQKALKRVDTARQSLVVATGAALAFAVLHPAQAVPALVLGAAAVGLRGLLGQLRQGFFTSRKPPGTQWHEAAPHPAVEWTD